MAGEFKNAETWVIDLLKHVDGNADHYSGGEQDRYPSGIKDELMHIRYGGVAVSKSVEGAA